MADLFELTELASLLQQDVDTATATLARDMATGFVTARVIVLPDPVPAALKAVALRIASRIYNNPTGAKAESIGGYSSTPGEFLDAADDMVLSAFRAGATVISVPLIVPGSPRASKVDWDIREW